MKNKAEVVKEIRYGYNGIINISDIVQIIHIENDNIVLIETEDNIRIRVSKDKLKII